MDMPTADMGEVEVPQADLSLLSRVEEAPATRLPSFDDFLRKSSSAPAQPDDGFASKLPAINQGKPGYIERDDGKARRHACPRAPPCCVFVSTRHALPRPARSRRLSGSSRAARGRPFSS
eukprot:7066179-Prymnesium_polylepis.1